MMILPSEWLATKRSTSDGAPGTWPKRVLDLVVASTGVLVLLPVFLLVAIAIKLDSRGPAFYAQERVGINRRRRLNSIPAGQDRRKADVYGRPFRIYKFRSMVADAERGTGPVWACAQDKRVTRLGRILRRTRLDEFPQLWNVVRGEMSIVGPRPERPNFVQSLASAIPDYPNRYARLPGITGLAQVKSRYDTSTESVRRKLQYDLYYLRNCGLMLDLKIMAATVKVMARGDGAH